MNAKKPQTASEAIEAADSLDSQPPQSGTAGPDTPAEALEGKPTGEQDETRPEDLPDEKRMTPLAQQNSNHHAGPVVGEIKPEGARADEYEDDAEDPNTKADD